MPDDTREFECFRLVLTIAGPNYTGEVALEARDSADLEPAYRDVNGLSYERYLGDRQDDHDLDDGAQEWVEVRFDYVVQRELTIVYKDPKPGRDGLELLSEEEIARLPAEQRVERRQDG